jgi:SAM-dependent methyltransferase
MRLHGGPLSRTNFLIRTDRAVSVRSLVKQNKALSCLYYVASDIRAGRRLRRGDITTDSGRRHASQRIEDSLSYIQRIYDDYLSYGKIGSFSGRVCEIGPGDNFGLALMALGHGASSVVSIDRFYSRRDARYQEQLYERLRQDNHWDHLFEGPVAEDTIRGLDYRPGQAAETFFRDNEGCFDYVISRAVLEHLYNPVHALADMKRSLCPGGMLIHRVDLRDHGMFSGHHPLTFLTVGEGLYRRMTRHSGRPNRVLLPEYRDWLAQSGLNGDIMVTRVVGVEDEVRPAPWSELDAEARGKALEVVGRIRPKLAPRFASLTDEDLAVSGIVLVAKDGHEPVVSGASSKIEMENHRS